MLAPSRRFVLLFALGLLGGCTAQKHHQEKTEPAKAEEQQPLEEPVQEIAPVQVEASFLVWARGTVGEASSYRIDDKGQVLEEFEGIRIQIDGAEWRWQEERLSQSDDVSNGCGQLEGDESGEGGGKSFVTRATIARNDESASQLVVDPQLNEEDATDFEHLVTVVRSVGPLLFVRQATHVYGCGAHGNLGASALVWDVSKNAEVEPALEPSEIEPLRKEAERILASDDDALLSDGDDEVTLAELLPAFTPRGELELQLRFTGFACYACSDGEWSSYTKSIVLPAKRLPKALAAYAQTPTAVRAFAESRPELELGGWSALHVIAPRPVVGIVR